MDEDISVRIGLENGREYFKLKTFAFKCQETYYAELEQGTIYTNRLTDVEKPLTRWFDHIFLGDIFHIHLIL